ncbi:solute:Na+ symporter SSS family [Fusarium tjaetaba]|uniref:Solute:Na+ symporter SSS family n=1 Tax=Fusarium tjaetaba TaxID=1567544 RepID=A0A8H5S815_9HYPO|nr:solute:Na+ symporter SSS family [Fusarium tjaetaba]KAF5647037.1 solute:Na+ symporter SSS family [Fusarium tjaetaba]
MLAIETVTLAAGQRLPLTVANTKDHHDLDCFNQPTKDYDTDILYDAQSGQAAPRPVVAILGDRTVQLTVRVRVPEELQHWPIVLSTDQSRSTYYSSCDFGTDPDPDIVVCNMMMVHSDGPGVWNPGSLLGPTQFYVSYAPGDIMEPVLYREQPAKVPMELYLLSNELPSYFSSGVPLLLLQMFMGAAMQRNITNVQQWMELVVKICHGSAKPLTGEPANTQDHWLKYNTGGGAPSFIQPNKNNPDPIPVLNTYQNYGGCFQLSAWLDAYRNFKQSGALTLVNCYDQAGAVELAASLGVDYDCIAWEFHQTYGYISKTTELVGWGHCNNPFFNKNPKNKVLEEKDPARQPFSNHAFLSWSPEFDPSTAFYLDKTDPSTYTDVNMLALHACAGPHLGNETRGVWVSPTSYPPGYTDNSTYWKTRDDQYPDNASTHFEGLTDRHFWTPGITGLSSDKAQRSYGPLPADPFAGTEITFPTPADFPDSTMVLGGSVSSLQSFFTQALMQDKPDTSDWKSVPIADILLRNNAGVVRETKLFDPKQPAFDYASLKISVMPSLSAALDLQRARATQVIITSTMSASDFTPSLSSQASTRRIHILQADYTSILVCLNLVVEISGYISKEIVQGLTSSVAQQLEGFPSEPSSQWQQILQ